MNFSLSLSLRASSGEASLSSQSPRCSLRSLGEFPPESGSRASGVLRGGA